MALTPGTRLGQYEVAASIGAGGMGEVYRARDSKLARDVAIKTLPSELANDPDRLTRFQREARVLASLNHPNIGAIYGLEESRGVSYLVLELIDGETLAERLMRAGPMASGEVLRIAGQIAEALEAANAKGITHRDIKPSNIKVTPEGRIKVLDFGIAKTVVQAEIQDGVETRSTLTAATRYGAVVGTPPYMSPEQIRGQAVDQRTDVWAFGCVVYELLSGSRPFRGPTAPDLVAAILQGEPDWDRLPGGVPEDVRRLLRRCLDKDVSRRPENFGVIRTELARTMSTLAEREHARPWVVLLMGALPVAVTALLALGRPDLLAGPDSYVYDAILRWSTSLPPDPRVVIVDIDERSLASIGQWPWRRDVVGRLVSRLRDLGVGTIALNIMLAEPDRSRGPEVAGDGSSRMPDELLAESLRGGRVVLGYAMTFEAGPTPVDHCELHPLNLAVPTAGESAGLSDTPFFKATGAVCGLRSLAEAAGQSGFLNGAPDPDGVLRRLPLVLELNGRVYPSLGLAAVAMATATRDAALRVVDTNHVSLTLGQRVVPLDGDSQLLLRYRGPSRTLHYVSAVDVMEGRASRESIRDKIAFVGTTALGERNVVATPLDTLFLDIEVQATAADNLLQQDFVYRPGSGRVLEGLAVLGLGVAITLLTVRVGLPAGILAALGALAALWAGAAWLLSTSGVFLSPFYSTVGVALAFLSLTVGKVGIERRRAEMALQKVESTMLNR